MVQNYSGTRAHPIVNVYCGGVLKATYGASPDRLQNFSGIGGGAIGAMWRVLEVYPEVDDDGDTVDCRVDALHPPGASSGYWVTQGDVSF